VLECAFPYIWRVARDGMGKDRECKKCYRHSSVHRPFTSINPDIVRQKIFRIVSYYYKIIIIIRLL
jgi:hypothetical protein